MELVEAHRLFLSSLFGVGSEEELEAILPSRYLESEEYAMFKKTNAKRQALETPSVVSTDSVVAYRRFVGKRGEDIHRRVATLRKQHGIRDGAELVIETDQNMLVLFVMSDDVDGRERIAAALQEELNGILEILKARVSEWALPGTSVRAVIGTGGECRELLFRPTQSIVVRFRIEALPDRLLEPIVVVNSIPSGFFTSLAEVGGVIPPDAEITPYLRTIGGATHESNAAQRKRDLPDLSEVTVAHITSAIAYTAGGVACYGVNTLLRNLDLGGCQQHQLHIRSLLAFQRGRSRHLRNASNRGKIVFRGCMLPRDMLSQYTVGEIVVWPAFTSTSVNRAVAEMFGGGGGGSATTASVLFEIVVETWCPLRDISVFPQEEEILLPAFSAFKVVTIRDDGVGGGVARPIRITLQQEADALSAVASATSEPGPLIRRSSSDDGSWGPTVFDDDSSLDGLAGVVDVIGIQCVAFTFALSFHLFRAP